jgi:DNA-directed RNA polymerase II subunit RPB1
VGSPEYTPVSRLWRAAGSPVNGPSDPPAAGAGSPDCALASAPRRAASPDYTPRTPPARAPPPQSPDYSRPLPPSPLVPDADPGTSPARCYLRRHHPYQRSGAATCTRSASGSGIDHGQRHLVY